MNHNQKERARYILIAALVVIILTVLALYIAKKNQQSTLTNDGFTYSFVFNDSKAENANGIAGLTSKDGRMSISMWPSKENKQLPCGVRHLKSKTSL